MSPQLNGKFLESRISSLTSSTEALNSRIGSLCSQVESAASRNHALISQLATAKAANGTVLRNLRDAQSEAERYHLLWRKAARRLIKVERLERLGSLDSSDHRSLNYRFHKFSYYRESRAQLDIRLVRHWGREGLVVFSSGGDQPALNRWEPDGEEGGRPFMIFVPKDDKGRQVLVSATSHDLCLLRDCVAIILEDLHAHPMTNDPTGWLQVAAGLMHSIDDLPRRLHYDDVKTSHNFDGTRGTLDLEITNPSHRGQLFSSFLLSLKVNSGGFVRKGPVVTSLKVDPVKLVRQSIVAEEFFRKPICLEPASLPKFADFSQVDLEKLYVCLAEMPNFFYHLKSHHPDLPFHTSGNHQVIRRIKSSVLKQFIRKATAFAV